MTARKSRGGARGSAAGRKVDGERERLIWTINVPSERLAGWPARPSLRRKFMKFHAASFSSGRRTRTLSYGHPTKAYQFPEAPKTGKQNPRLAVIVLRRANVVVISWQLGRLLACPPARRPAGRSARGTGELGETNARQAHHLRPTSGAIRRACLA